MAVANPYKQGATSYIDTLPTPGVVPGTTIPVGAGLTGATAGAPVVQPKPVATKTVTPTAIDVTKQNHQAMQPQTPTTAQPTQVVLPDALDTQKMEYQAQQQQAATQMVSQSPTEQQAAQIALQQEQQKQSAAPTTTEQQAAGTQATATPTTQAATAPTVEENPYQKQLETLKFEYNPQTDPQYLQDAAGLENQVVQMMTGRGGLYSSVAQAALQSRLVALQNDFRTQKYAQFVQDRNFLFDQSKQWFSEQATKWEQAQTEKEFAFAQEKEKFDQQMALAQYNLQVQAQQFSQAQARAAARSSSTQAQYKQQLNVAEKGLDTAQKTVQRNAMMYYRESTLYKQYLDKWKKSGIADTYVAKYFGVSQNAPLSRSASAITTKAAYLDAYKSAIKDAADDYNMAADLLDQVKLFQENKFVASPTNTPTAPVNADSWLGSGGSQRQQTR